MTHGEAKSAHYINEMGGKGMIRGLLLSSGAQKS